jgi:hypothetical protein
VESLGANAGCARCAWRRACAVRKVGGGGGGVARRPNPGRGCAMHLIQGSEREYLSAHAPSAACDRALVLARKVLTRDECLVGREVPAGEVAVDETEDELARLGPRGKARIEMRVALEGVRAEDLRRKLHPLPLLHALGSRREPEKGTAVVLHRRERRARRLPAQEYDTALRRQLDAVDCLPFRVDDLQ